MSQFSKEAFSIRQRLNSFRCAFAGLRTLIATEHNAQIHCVIAVVAIGLAWLLNISRGEWLIVILVIGLVLSAEAFNTALEKLCDHITPEHHPSIGSIKDTAAAAVLIISIMALIAGLVIFLPYIV